MGVSQKQWELDCIKYTNMVDSYKKENVFYNIGLNAKPVLENVLEGLANVLNSTAGKAIGLIALTFIGGYFIGPMILPFVFSLAR